MEPQIPSGGLLDAFLPTPSPQLWPLWSARFWPLVDLPESRGHAAGHAEISHRARAAEVAEAPG